MAQIRVIMMVDLDYFYAQCEERRNNFLKDRPLVVCVYSGRSENSGAVATSNYIARKMGVKSGMSIFLAKKKLADSNPVFFPADYKFYEQTSERIMKILRKYADLFEQVSIDEAYLDVSKKVQGDFKYAKELAERIKKDVKSSEDLICSIGVGPNKLLAKIAASFQKPDGLTVVKPSEIKDFLSPMSVDNLIGVGKKTSSKMGTLGIKTIGDLSKVDIQKLIQVFGGKNGTYFHYASHGIDNKPVKEREGVESLSRISTLMENTRDIEKIVKNTDKLCEEIHEKLVLKGISFRSITLIAIAEDLTIHTRSKTLNISTKDKEVLKGTIRYLVENLINETQYEIRRIGVKISKLDKRRIEQKNLSDYKNNSLI